MYYVYALVSANRDRIYVGLTKDLNSRLKEHNSWRTRSTKYYNPWLLFYFEKLDSRLEARLREIKLKSEAAKEFLKKVLEECARSSIG